jgi:hypothetical protein
MPEALKVWTDFNVAMVGATAALAGLLIVAMSVNLKSIVTSVALTARVAAALSMLVVALAASALGLAPEQPIWAYGLEVLAATAVGAFFELQAIREIHHQPIFSRTQRFTKSLAGTTPVVAYLVGSVLLIVGFGEAGLWFVAVGAILAIASAILHSWVVLVEVLR